ncbi:MAG: hypothetical protein LUD39_04105 [Opitutae bacterium]|nr:hypothetical protein [Opitutae bacterium]MCD8298925.1 hypothetical protein [Opitutae bacterium]
MLRDEIVSDFGEIVKEVGEAVEIDGVEVQAVVNVVEVERATSVGGWAVTQGFSVVFADMFTLAIPPKVRLVVRGENCRAETVKESSPGVWNITCVKEL